MIDDEPDNPDVGLEAIRGIGPEVSDQPDPKTRLEDQANAPPKLTPTQLAEKHYEDHVTSLRVQIADLKAAALQVSGSIQSLHIQLYQNRKETIDLIEDRSYAVAGFGSLILGSFRYWRTAARMIATLASNQLIPVAHRWHSRRTNARIASPMWLRCDRSCRA